MLRLCVCVSVVYLFTSVRVQYVVTHKHCRGVAPTVRIAAACRISARTIILDSTLTLCPLLLTSEVWYTLLLTP